jgi:hypothetical protein
MTVSVWCGWVDHWLYLGKRESGKEKGRRGHRAIAASKQEYIVHATCQFLRVTPRMVMSEAAARVTLHSSPV